VLVLLARAYPGSGADLVDWRPTRSYEDEARLESEDIQQMIEARSKDIESKLKSQYDDNIKQLQKKLEDSRKAAAGGPDKDKDKAATIIAAPAADARTRRIGKELRMKAQVGKQRPL